MTGGGGLTFRGLTRKVLGILLTAVVFVLATGYFFRPTYGAEATARKDTLSTSAPGTDADHTLTFTLQNTWDAGEMLRVTFVDDDWDTSGFAVTEPEDFDIKDDGSDITITANGACAADQIEINAVDITTGDYFEFELCAASTSIASGSVIEIQIGNNATFATGTGNDQIGNPTKVLGGGTADIYTISLSGDSGTTGDILVAVQDQVTVSVTVDETLTFTIAQGAACTGDTGSPTSINASVTATTVPYSTVNSDTFYVGCHDITVGTNAGSGYSLTGEENQSLRTTGGTLISNGTCDGGGSPCDFDTGAAWATPGNNGFGYFCEGITDAPCDTSVDSTSEYKTFACTGTVTTFCTPNGSEAAQTIMTKAGATSSSVGRVHYKLSVDAAQAAGAYSNTVTYIATPTF